MKMLEFVSSETTITQDRTLGDLNYRSVLLTHLEAGKSKVKMLTPLVSGENPPPRSLMAVLLPFVRTRQQEGRSSLGH